MDVLSDTSAVCNPFRVMSLSMQVGYYLSFVRKGNTISEEFE